MMSSPWTAHLDAHIATGQVATEAESADMLGWLLKLEPEQRWCLLLNRDPCLMRLVAGDYSRLVTLMVELEAAALAQAPQPPCLEQLPPPPRLQFTTQVRRSRRWLIAGVSTVAAGIAVSLWLTSPSGQPHWQRWQTWGQQHWSAWFGTETTTAQYTAALTAANERQRQALAAFVVLETIAKKLEAGQVFAPELTALKTIWPVPAQLDVLLPYATPASATPVALRAELARRNAQLIQHSSELLAAVQTGRLLVTDFYAQMPLLEQQRSAVNTALAQTQDDNWAGAVTTLAAYTDDPYPAWRQQVTRWLAAQRTVADLISEAWSRQQWQPTAAAP